MWWAPKVYQSTTSVILERRVVPHVGGQTGAARVLVRILAGRIALARIVARDPEVPGHEGGALGDGGLGPRDGRTFSPGISL